jgi:hypothetical protein
MVVWKPLQILSVSAGFQTSNSAELDGWYADWAYSKLLLDVFKRVSDVL